MKGKVLLLSFLFMMGCQNLVWYHPAKTQQQFFRDRAECTSMANSGGAGYYNMEIPNQQTHLPYDSYGSFSQGFMTNYMQASAVRMREQIFCDCMRGRGWVLTDSVRSISNQSVSYESKEISQEEFSKEPDLYGAYLRGKNYKSSPTNKGTADMPKPSFEKSYIHVGMGHWISKNIDGEYIKLEDGSLWEVSPIDVIDSLLWLPVSEITVIESGNPYYPYFLINTDDDEKVEAKLVAH